MLSSVANSDAAKVLVMVNKIFFCSLIVAVTMTRRRGISGMEEEDGVENLWAKTPSQATYFLSIFLYCHIILFFFPFLFPFPGILGNDSL